MAVEVHLLNFYEVLHEFSEEYIHVLWDVS